MLYLIYEQRNRLYAVLCHSVVRRCLLVQLLDGGNFQPVEDCEVWTTTTSCRGDRPKDAHSQLVLINAQIHGNLKGKLSASDKSEADRQMEEVGGR